MRSVATLAGVAVAHEIAIHFRPVVRILARPSTVPSTVLLTCKLFQSALVQQIAYCVFLELLPSTALEAARQHECAVTSTDQARNSQSDSFKHAANFAIAAFADRDPIPAIDALAAAIGDA